MTLDWKLNVWTPTGTGPRTIERDHTFIRSTGLRMKVAPEGDGIEASFDAKGAGLLIPPLSAVQVVHRSGGVETPVYYGQVRQGGNARDVHGERYVLRSLALKLKHAILPVTFSTPKQPAHLTMRAILQAVLPQLDGLILYDETLIPDLQFDALEIKAANAQPAWAFLERLQQDGKGLGVDVRLGVRADRKFYCQAARTDTLALTLEQLARVKWNAPEAEDPCTAVQWLIARRPDGSSWVTHDSLNAAAITQHGHWTKPATPGANVKVLYSGEGTYTATGSQEPLATDADKALRKAILTDGRRGSENGSWINLGVTSTLSLTLTGPADLVDLSGISTGQDAIRITRQDPGGPVTELYQVTTQGEWGGVLQGPFLTGTVFKVEGVSAQYPRAYVGEMRAEWLDRPLLDQLAEFHYRVPAVNPADLEVNAFLPPASLTGRVSAGTYENPVEAWEYRLSAATGLTTAALAGQADKPEDLARAALIRARDRDATLAALTAQT